MAARAEVAAIVGCYLEALERFDLEAAADCFTGDLFYSHPPYSTADNGGLRHEVRGRDALIGLFRERGRRAVVHSIRSTATNGSVAFVEGVFIVNGEVGGSFVSVVEAADGLGFDSLWLGEHVVLPVEYETPHPTTSSKTKQHHTGPIVDPSTRLLDPWLLLGAMASVTQHMLLATGIYILPLRHPLLTARAGANAHDLSGGRVVLGIGAGWLREEFEALDVPFEERRTRMEESIEILRSAWKGGPFSFHGKRFSFDTVQVTPHAVGPPIILGGNTERALQRAVRLGDGWFSSGTPSLDEALALQARIQAIRAEHGMAGEFRCYFRMEGAEPTNFDRYREAGIDNLVIWADRIWPAGESLEHKREALAEAAERLGVRAPSVS